MSSISYASYLASMEDSIQHREHIYQFQEMATMIAREQIELYLPKIEAMVNTAISKSLSSALSGIDRATTIDVNEIVNVVVKDMNKEFHSERLQTFVADTLKMKLEDALKNIDVKLIVS